MIRFLALIVALASTSAHAYKVFVGDVTQAQDVTLLAGEEYVVPKCRKLLLKDLHKYDELTWLKIDGGVEVTSVLNGRESGVHLIEGRFTYTAKPGNFEVKVSALPGSRLILFSKAQVNRIEASEYSWVYEEGHACLR